MKENLSNSKNNKAKIYKALSIAGISTLIGGGLIGIGATVANIVTTKEKNLGTDYGQGLNFNLQFSLNDPSFNTSNVDGMIEKLQDTANALSSKLFKLGLKQIKLTPKIGVDPNIKNSNITNPDLKNVFGIIDVNVDSQEGTRWYLDPKVQGLFERLTALGNDTAKQNQLIQDYANEFYPDKVNAEESVISDLAQNAANKLAIYFATESVGNVSLSANTNQPILNNTNNIEFQSINKGEKRGSNQEKKEPQFNNPLLGSSSQEIIFKDINNNSKNTRLNQIDNNGTKTINFEVDIPNLSKVENWKPYNPTAVAENAINTKGEYLDLSGFMNQFNKVFKWQEHNDSKPDEQWKTMEDAVEAMKSADSTYESKLPAPQSTWLIWTNRSGLINRLNYIALLAYISNIFSSYQSINSLTYTYWNNLVGDQNKNYTEFSGEGKKPITGKLISAITDANNEETKYYYWVKEKLALGNQLSSYFFDLDFISENEITNSTSIKPNENEKLMLVLNEFYTTPNLFENSSSSSSSESSPSAPTTYASSATTNFDWIRSWSLSSHDLISPYSNVVDYANFYKIFKLDNLENVFGKNELNNYNQNNSATPINQYNAAFTNMICYNTNQKSISDAQNILDDFTKYNYGNDLISSELINTSEFIRLGSSKPTTNVNQNILDNLNTFSKFIFNFATLSPATLSNSVIGLNAWTSTIIGISVVILIIGIIISVLYRVPGVFATITAFLASVLSLIVYRNLNLTFSFDTSIALLAGIFISFITIVNFLSYIPRLLKDKNLNLKFGVIKSFKYFIRNSIGIHVTALIIALVFLYFGQFQIQGFGSMLVINTLLSLLLNIGVFIGFISILSFGLLMYKPSLMFNKVISEHIVNIELTGFDTSSNMELKPWIAKFSNSILFNKWWTWMIAIIVGVLSIIGIVLLVCGVGSNTLINSNLFTIEVLSPDAINTLKENGISVVNNLAHVSSQILNSKTILRLIFEGKISISQENLYITNMVVKSLVNTCLIAMGFCLIWSLLWLNIINIINVFVVQLLSLLTFGLLGIFQLPIDINVIIMISLGFLINNVMIYSNFINLKFSYQMKSSWSNEEIKAYVIKNQKENISLYLVEYFVTICCLLFMMIFVSKDNIVANGMIVIDLILNLGLIYALIPYLFMGMMMAREKYVLKSVNHKKHANHVDYDKVDEQEIVGINKHVYSPL